MTDAPGGNLPLVGKLLALSGLVLLGVALAAWMRWLPYAEGSQSLLAKVFAVTGVIDLTLGFVFMRRDNQ
jgi:hypothetical protein